MTFHRARAPEQKADRRDAILRAAHALFVARGCLPTAAEVAEKTALAKGTVYLYFRSKEEIYLALLQNSYLIFLTALSTRLRQHDHCGGEVIAEQVLLTLHEHREFMPLSALAHAILEQNVSTDAIKNYKQALAKGLMECVQIITERGQLDHDEAMQLLLCSYALITGLWQSSHPPESVRNVVNESGMDFMNPDFWREVKFALRRLWRD